MTGGMSRSDVTREAFPLHFAIADRTGGEVQPFDVYQGPYVYVERNGKGKRFWIIDGEDGFSAQVYEDHEDLFSMPFPAYAPMSEELAADAAEYILAE